MGFSSIITLILLTLGYASQEDTRQAVAFLPPEPTNRAVVYFQDHQLSENFSQKICEATGGEIPSNRLFAEPFLDHWEVDSKTEDLLIRALKSLQGVQNPELVFFINPSSKNWGEDLIDALKRVTGVEGLKISLFDVGPLDSTSFQKLKKALSDHPAINRRIDVSLYSIHESQSDWEIFFEDFNHIKKTILNLGTTVPSCTQDSGLPYLCLGASKKRVLTWNNRNRLPRALTKSELLSIIRTGPFHWIQEAIHQLTQTGVAQNEIQSLALELIFNSDEANDSGLRALYIIKALEFTPEDASILAESLFEKLTQTPQTLSIERQKSVLNAIVVLGSLGKNPEKNAKAAILFFRTHGTFNPGMRVGLGTRIEVSDFSDFVRMMISKNQPEKERNLKILLSALETETNQAILHDGIFGFLYTTGASTDFHSSTNPKKYSETESERIATIIARFFNFVPSDSNLIEIAIGFFEDDNLNKKTSDRIAVSTYVRYLDRFFTTPPESSEAKLWQQLAIRIGKLGTQSETARNWYLRAIADLDPEARIKLLANTSIPHYAHDTALSMVGNSGNTVSDQNADLLVLQAFERENKQKLEPHALRFGSIKATTQAKLNLLRELDRNSTGDAEVVIQERKNKIQTLEKTLTTLGQIEKKITEEEPKAN